MYPCLICGYKATQKSSLNSHNQAQHKGKKYQCNSCENEYNYASGLKKHTKSKLKGVTYDCTICQSRFTRKDSLTIHINSVHRKISMQFMWLSTFRQEISNSTYEKCSSKYW